MNSHRRRSTALVVFLGILLITTTPGLAQGQNTNVAVPYGNNPAAGNYAEVNGIRMYYEVYGQGAPLVLIHGNSGSIADMANQIPFFAKHYRVIVADSREHGKTNSDGKRLTYEKMAGDWAHLLDYLKVDSAYVIGWSDGGILGLLLAIHHPAKVRKLAAMGANLEPDSTAVYGWAVRWVQARVKLAEDSIKRGIAVQAWQHEKRMLDLLGNQPHIPKADLRRIQAPTLVMSGDKDVIREEHTVKIYQSIAKAHLCIFPGATHLIPIQDPGLFNQTVLKFFQEPFRRLDTKDFLN
jgi:pimeloyl-ACP methyl ester carboxylesterase